MAWSWTEQVAKGRDGAEWTGIRNFAAQKHLRAMQRGERAFFYHTGKERAIVGIVEVIAEAHADSTDPAWFAVDVAAVEPLPMPVGLDRIKADKRLAGMTLARQPRLSVQPVTTAEWRLVSRMGGLGRDDAAIADMAKDRSYSPTGLGTTPRHTGTRLCRPGHR